MITTGTPTDILTGHGLVLTPTAGGYDIWIDGTWCGWSAGNKTDARNTARDILRDRATRCSSCEPRTHVDVITDARAQLADAGEL